MQPGILNRWLEIMPQSGAGWASGRNVYGGYRYAPRVIYSPFASGSEGAEFTLRRQKLGRGELIAFGESVYIVSSVDDTDRAYLTVQAAKVRPEEFAYERTVSALGRLNRPENTVERGEFEGIIGEKYVNHAYGLPNAEIASGLILTTPKAVELRGGDVIMRGGKKYAVLAAHTEDEALNNYEVERREDA